MLPKLPDELFSSAELARFEGMSAEMVRRAKHGGLIAAKAAMTLIALLGCIAIEYYAFKDIYDFLKPPMPGEALALSPSVLALTGCVMVLAMHLRAAMNPDSMPVRVLERAVDILLPLYMIGAALMFAGVLFFNGADGMFASSSGSLNIFAAPEAETPLLTRLFERGVAPLISVLFTLGAGAVVVITVFVGHRCLSRLKDYITDLWGRVADAREAVAAHAAIVAKQEAYRLARGRLMELTERSVQHAALAAEIGSVIDEELRPYKLFILDRRLNPEPNPYEPQRELNVDEIEHRVRDIEAIAPEEIMAAMRGTFTQENHDEVPPYDPFYDDVEPAGERGDAYRRH
jgi:hypothetical protein